MGVGGGVYVGGAGGVYVGVGRGADVGVDGEHVRFMCGGG